MSNDFSFIREVRDPIYTYIYLTKNECEIIDTPSFQRLDRLLQTPSAHFVYPNATHTRKAHSFGVMHLAQESLCRIIYRQSKVKRKKLPKFLATKCVISKEIKNLDCLDTKLNLDFWDNNATDTIIETFRVAGLLHDLGHGPFSHIFEDACNILSGDNKCDPFSHEDMSAKIITEKLSSKFIDISPEEVIKILSGTSEVKFLSEILDGPYDIDKLDYLVRDSFHCGASEYGTVDFERILSGFRIKNNKLHISSSALNAIMNTFYSAQNMYSNVYYHKTARIIDFMIMDSLLEIPELLQKIISDVDYFISIDDHNILSEIKNLVSQTNSENNYKAAYDIMKNAMDRKLKYYTEYIKMITLGAAIDMDEEFTKLKEEIESEFEDLSAKVDFSTKVKPVRVNPIRLLKWLETPTIFDERTDEVVKLWNLNKAYFDTLTKSQVMFNVLIDREISKKRGFNAKRKKLRERIDTEISNIEELVQIRGRTHYV